MTTIALVTGASGWLGRGLVKALHEGIEGVDGLEVDADREVRCLVQTERDRLIVEAVSPRVKSFFGDICDLDSLNAFFEGAQDATLFHCAGIIHPRRIVDLYRINCEGTENLLVASRKFGVRRFILVSSNSPFGSNSGVDQLFDEQSPYNPYLNYGRSKYLAEEYIKANTDGDLETTIVRPTWFYGPGQPRRQTTFFSMIKNGRMPIVGGGANRRSMAYVDNICQGLLLCENSSQAIGQSYWIADKMPYSMRQIVDVVSDVMENDFGMNVARKQIEVPNIVSNVAGRLDHFIQSTGLYHQKIHVLSEMNSTIACSISKAQKELGYNPRIELREGMRRSILSILRQGDEI